MRNLIVTLEALVFMSSCAVFAGEDIMGMFDKPLNMQQVEAVRTQFEACSSESLGLKGPIKVTFADSYTDGGTVCITVVDSNGKELKACMDFRLETETPTRTYLDVHHPSQTVARIIRMGGAEEKALYSLLITWAKTHPLPETKQKTKKTDEYVVKQAHHYLFMLDRRFYNLVPKKEGA